MEKRDLVSLDFSFLKKMEREKRKNIPLVLQWIIQRSNIKNQPIEIILSDLFLPRSKKYR